MEALVLKKKVSLSRQIIVDLPQLNVGDDVELIVVFNSTEKASETKKKIFDMEKWADQWETDLGENIQFSNVENFTGRSF